MAEPKGNVWLVDPPSPTFLRVANIVARPLLSSPLGGLFDGTMLLEFKGRRSGRTIKVPVSRHVIDGEVVVFTDAPWRWNFDGGAPVKVTFKGSTTQGQGTLEHVTPERMGELARNALDAGEHPRVIGVGTAKDHQPTAEELAALGPKLGKAIVHLKLEA